MSWAEDEAFDAYDDEDVMFGRSRACRKCGREGLYFQQEDDGRWILVDGDGEPHVCGLIGIELQSTRYRGKK